MNLIFEIQEIMTELLGMKFGPFITFHFHFKCVLKVKIFALELEKNI